MRNIKGDLMLIKNGGVGDELGVLFFQPLKISVYKKGV